MSTPRRWSVCLSMLAISVLVAAGSGCSLNRSGEQAAAASEAPSHLIKEAKAEYDKQGAFSDGMSERLLASRKSLVPIVKRGLQSGALTKPEQMAFWAKLAGALNDKALTGSLLAFLESPTNTALFNSYQWYEAYFQALTVAVSGSGRERLVEQMEHTDGAGMEIILSVLAAESPSRQLEEASLAAWEEKYAGKAQMNGIVDFYIGQDQYARLMRLYDKGVLSSRLETRIVQQVVWSAKIGAEQRSWLADLAASTDRYEMEQQIDIELLKRFGDQGAAARLIVSGDKYGFQTGLDAITSARLVKLFPQSKLSRGVARYEAIKGSPFFSTPVIGGYMREGDDYAKPAWGIAKWKAFLQDFPLHPAADDAAYRLARCYEISGQIGDALYWFDQSSRMGDGDMSSDAKGMILYALDVEELGMGYSDAGTVKLPEWMKPWLEYTAALEELRAGRYAHAANVLQQFVARYDGTDMFAAADAPRPAPAGSEVGSPLDTSPYPFWEHVKEQKGLAKELAGLDSRIAASSGSGKEKWKYDQAALIYREPLLYYNYLWRDNRQIFFWFGHIKDKAQDERLGAYIHRFNHYARAADAFALVDGRKADPDTAAKALFSQALSLVKFTESGVEFAYDRPREEIVSEVGALAQRLFQEAPDSTLTDDAFMLAYHASHDDVWLDRIVEKYPKGDQAASARKLLKETR